MSEINAIGRYYHERLSRQAQAAGKPRGEKRPSVVTNCNEVRPVDMVSRIVGKAAREAGSRARRRRGEIVEALPKQTGGDARKIARGKIDPEQIIPTLAEQGIDRREASVDTKPEFCENPAR